MVNSIDSMLIKKLCELLNVILVISIVTWQDKSLLEFYSGESVILTTIATVSKEHTHIFTHNFLNIQPIFNPQKVLES